MLLDQSKNIESNDAIVRIKSILLSLETLDQLMEIYGLIVLLSYKSETLAKDALRYLSSVDQDWIGNISKLALELWIPLTEVRIPISKIAGNFPSNKVDENSSNAWKEENIDYIERSSK